MDNAKLVQIFELMAKQAIQQQLLCEEIDSLRGTRTTMEMSAHRQNHHQLPWDYQMALEHERDQVERIDKRRTEIRKIQDQISMLIASLKE